MSRLIVLCLLLSACEPLPPIPVPVEQPPALEPAPEPEPAQAEPVVEQNRAPVILAIELEPGQPRTGDDLEVRVTAEDPDDDNVRVERQWFINDREVRGQRGKRLPHTYFEKGDEVRLRVIAKDGEYETEGSTPVILVRNTPPEIVNKSGTLRSIEGYQVRAQDVDGDDLSWHLEGEPAGMTVDAGSGTLHYAGSEDAAAGAYNVQVIVEDPDGGSARWSFGITVEAGSGGSKECEKE